MRRRSLPAEGLLFRTKTAGDAKHLTWLRDQLGEQFVRGVVLHVGRYPMSLGERIIALPSNGIWS